MNDYINPQGTLIDILKQVDVSTVLHAAEIQKHRLTDKSLRNISFWTANFALYTLEDGEPILYLASRENNLIFKNIDFAVDQLNTTDNYFPKNNDIQSVIKSSTTLKFELSELKLFDYENDAYNYDNELSYFNINTKKFDELNSVQRKLAEELHGKGDDFYLTMQMLSNEKINTTPIYTLNPEYIERKLEENNAEGLGRAVFLYDFSPENGSHLQASYRNVYKYFRGLRALPVNSKVTMPEKEPEKKKETRIINPWDVDIPTINNKILDYKN